GTFSASFLASGAPQDGPGEGSGDPLSGYDLGELGTSIGGNELPGFEPGTGQIQGQVFFNHPQDGLPDDGASGVGGVTVFLAMGDGGVFDPGEPTTVTDEGGVYAFVGIPPGTYPICAVPSPDLAVVSPLPADLHATVDGGSTAYGVNIGVVPRQPN